MAPSISPRGVAPARRTFSAPSLIGLGHWARVGKDSLARQLVVSHGFVQLAFADALRDLAVKVDPHLQEVLRACGGDWEVAKTRDPSVRVILQRVGESARQTLGRDVWVRGLERRLRLGGRYVISDVRYPEEAQMIRRRGGCLVEVRRPGVRAANGHASEHALDEWRGWDAVVYNDGDVGGLAAAAAWIVELGQGPLRWTASEPPREFRCASH